MKEYNLNDKKQSLQESFAAKAVGSKAPGLTEDDEQKGFRPHMVDKTVLAEATQTLQKYKAGKAALEQRIIEDEQWYRIRHDEYLRRQKDPKQAQPIPTSAWMFDALANKHADATDNYPVPAVLPRERSDEESAKILSDILPVILERNDFEQVYSDNWWDKLKNGCTVYGVFWDTTADNGLGDISIKGIDLLNIFWEPGVEDIQASRNLFIVNLADKDLLEEEYPELKGHLDGDAVKIGEYVHDESIDTSNKVAVIDWYYKVMSRDGRSILHYVKYVNDTLLFATENEPAYQNTGWYDHGLYPVVFDTLFPEKGSPAGFGYIALTKDPQLYIDKLSGGILQNCLMIAKPRYFVAASTGVNKEQFADWSQDLIDVEGNDLDDTRIKQVTVNALPGNVLNVLEMKINELKETSSNRDYNSGGTTSGVTAAAAIAALQEAGNKTSRDMISASYRAYTKINNMVIELIRQFYDETRSFRINAANGTGYRFVDFSNDQIKPQVLPSVPGITDQMYRKPIFDITIKPQKRSPFSQLSQNEMAKEFYGLGFFNPELAQQSLIALEMMDFEGKEKIVEKIQEGQTLLNMLQQVTMERDLLAMQLQSRNVGLPSGAPSNRAVSREEKKQGDKEAVKKNQLGGSIRNAQTRTMTGYGEQLANRALPNMTESGNIGL